jgi:hypothetical protein
VDLSSDTAAATLVFSELEAAFAAVREELLAELQQSLDGRI